MTRRGKITPCVSEDRTRHEALRKESPDWVRKEIGAFAKPDIIQFAPAPQDTVRQDHAGSCGRSPRTSTISSATPISPIRRWCRVRSISG